MRPIGFCTGAVARGDFRKGLRLLEAHGTTAVEISAHRQQELLDLAAFLSTARPAPGFRHVSVHGPGEFRGQEDEKRIFALLQAHVPADWPIILHPNAVTCDDAWRSLGPQACFENMDRRKPTGKTCDEMLAVFARFPEATYCADIGHARQIDGSMELAALLLTTFRDRLREVHCSEVDPKGGHHPISREAQAAFVRTAHLIPADVPIILETDVAEADIAAELAKARGIFCAVPGPVV